MPEPVPGSQGGASSILTEFTLSPALLEQLKDVLRASLVGWAAVRVQDERALVLPAPDLDALYAALDGLLGGAWSLRYAVDQVSPAVVRAALIVGGTEREGLGQGHTLSDARLLALADACRAYGADAGQEGQWVEYDPEEGPNTAELEPQQPSAVQGTASGRPLPEPVRDPQLERARKHIDDLLEGLRDGGLGKRAAQVLARRGYGNTVEESREVYKELKALQARS